MIPSQAQSPSFKRSILGLCSGVVFPTTTLSSMERVRIQNGNSALTRAVGAGGDTPVSLDSGQRAVRILTTVIEAMSNALCRGGYGKMRVL